MNTDFDCFRDFNFDDINKDVNEVLLVPLSMGRPFECIYDLNVKHCTDDTIAFTCILNILFTNNSGP